MPEDYNHQEKFNNALSILFFVLFVSRQLLHALLYLLHPCSRSW